MISALTGEGVPALLEAVAAALAEPVEDETLHLRYDQGRERAWLFDHKLVRAEHADRGRLRRRRALDRPRRGRGTGSSRAPVLAASAAGPGTTRVQSRIRLRIHVR